MVGSKEKVCWICNRRFVNGRALGGHQKSHYALLPLPPKTEGLQSGAPSSSDLTLRLGAGNPIGRRSKRRRPAPARDVEAAPEETSGHKVISDNEAAGCLLMLWKGKNLKNKHSPGTSVIEDVAPTTEVLKLSSESSAANDDDDDDDYDFSKTFRCPYCDRTFGTPQGLGGHKRIHYRKPSESEQDSTSARVDGKTYTIDLNLMPEPEDSDED
ncbi:hypothetical protein MLD38_008939 [Melastoma candidum]|uniref:Uncharacterized protein n=1 Tax=Melastoma candidum TaxID=119954 RepID=A0ACB9S0A0_9MYRT|nr:hypothetical protein MLD38_008939 [Melastoma candidum]